MDKEHHTSITEAQDALFTAEKTLYENEGLHDTGEEYHKLQEVVRHFKEMLLGAHVRTDAVGTELQILRDKQETFLRKVGEVKERDRGEELAGKEEEGHAEVPDRVLQEPSETLAANHHYVTVWEVVHADGPPPA